MPIGGSYLVDYNGPRPDSMTEEALARILDAPPAGGLGAGGAAEAGPRWRRSAAAPLSEPHQPSCSAPASVAGSEGAGGGSPERGGAGGGRGGGSEWACGSLSLPGSTRTTPLLLERDRVWEAPGAALADLPKSQLAARCVAGTGRCERR